MNQPFILAKTPKPYKPILNLRETEKAIRIIKDQFEHLLADTLNLELISAPLFVLPETGLNDDLNGVERKVSFDVHSLNGHTVEVVQSLAKWKRNALHVYGFNTGEGLYADMNAIRRDEVLTNLHSVYVDQWDWEKVITKHERTTEYLQSVVRSIYSVMRKTETDISELYPHIQPVLPERITFVTSQELEDMYPELTPRERENKACEKHGAIFLSQIGGKLKSGKKHDGRAPDYDDWELNGDIVLWNPVLESAFEISSMGIRVDAETLEKQLEFAEVKDRIHLTFHQGIINNTLPFSIGGGIGQSRICMFFLRKAHIGEVQASVWPDELVEECKALGIGLL